MRSLGQHLEANGVDLGWLRRNAKVIADVIKLGWLSNGSSKNDLEVVYSFVGWNSSQKESMPFDGMISILMSAKKQDLDTLRKSLGYRFPRGGKADCARNIVLFLRAFDWESLRIETAQLNPTSLPAVEANSSFVNCDWSESAVENGGDGLLTRYVINGHDRTGQILLSKSLGNIHADISLDKINFLQAFTPFEEPVGCPIAGPRFLFWSSADANLDQPKQFTVRIQTRPLRRTDMFEEQVHLRFLRVEHVGGTVKNVMFSPHGWVFIVNDKIVTAEHITHTHPVTFKRGKKRQQAPTAHVNLTSLLRESGRERAPSENEIRVWNVRLQELPQACLHIFFPQVVRSKSDKALVDDVRDATDLHFERLGCSPCPARESENRELEDQAAAAKSEPTEGTGAAATAAPTASEKIPASSSSGTQPTPEGSDAHQEKKKDRKSASVPSGKPATSRLEFAKKRASMMLWSSDGGLEVEQVKFSLRCPLSLSRIDIPAKGVDCTHVQCFDLVAFLKMARRSNTRECPVCCRWMTGNDSMYICPLYEDTLRRFPESDEAEFFPDGRIEPISTGKAVVPRHGGKKTVVVDVDDVNEADFATPLQTRLPSQTPAASAFPMKATGPSSTRAAHIHQSAVIDLTSDNEDFPRSNVAEASPSGRSPQGRETPATSNDSGVSSKDSTCPPLPSACGLDHPHRPLKTPRNRMRSAENLATPVRGSIAEESGGGHKRVSALGPRRSESSEDSRSFAERAQPHGKEPRKRLRSNDQCDLCSKTAGSTLNCSTPNTSTPYASTPNGYQTFSQHQQAADVDILDLT